MRLAFSAASLVLAASLGSAPAASQEATPLQVGVTAPDFQLTGATRHGVLRDGIKLSDYRGKTVVLAFFFRARTSG